MRTCVGVCAIWLLRRLLTPVFFVVVYATAMKLPVALQPLPRG